MPALQELFLGMRFALGQKNPPGFCPTPRVPVFWGVHRLLPSPGHRNTTYPHCSHRPARGTFTYATQCASGLLARHRCPRTIAVPRLGGLKLKRVFSPHQKARAGWGRSESCCFQEPGSKAIPRLTNGFPSRPPPPTPNLGAVWAVQGRTPQPHGSPPNGVTQSAQRFSGAREVLAPAGPAVLSRLLLQPSGWTPNLRSSGQIPKTFAAYPLVPEAPQSRPPTPASAAGGGLSPPPPPPGSRISFLPGSPEAAHFQAGVF